MEKNNSSGNGLPVVTLMLLAPIITEILPGATRFSAIFVFPIEVLVWGGGALLIRHAIRKWQLGWVHMLFLGLALSIAEEFLIQQTSLAPMVFQIKGGAYARAFGINYVYLLWALIYETVFVVFLPIYLTEILFPNKRNELWIGKRGVIITSLLFLLGSFFAWFSWTQIARTKVFKVPPYNPPLIMVCIAIILIGGLIFMSIGPFRNKFAYKSSAFNPPPDWITAIMGGLWAILLYGLVLLAFGISPSFPPLIAIVAGLLLTMVAIYLIPRWSASVNWQTMNIYALIFGVMTGAMLAGFMGFIGALKVDLYFKIIINFLAIIFMMMLGFRLKKRVALTELQNQTQNTGF